MRVLATYVADVLLKDLCVNKRAQLREHLSGKALKDYEDSYRAGESLPAIDVFHVPGGRKYPGDGFHRIVAARRAGLTALPCRIHHGGLREAVLFAASANALHGVRRTNADKRKAVAIFLKDREWKLWSDEDIARACAVTGNTVARMRKKTSPEYRDWRVETTERKFRRNGKVTIKRVKVPYIPPDGNVKATKAVGRTVSCPHCGQLFQLK